MTKKQSSKGFTLIEILVVIGIIAILAAVVLIAINPARQFAQANDSQRTSNLNAILNGIGQYIADNKGDVPPGIPVAPAAAADITEELCLALVPTYIPSLPTDPNSDYDGGSIAEADCDTLDVDDSGYTVLQDGDGRITVSAVGEITNPITVTR